MPAASILNVEKRFGNFQAVDDLTLDVPEGKILRPTPRGPSRSRVHCGRGDATAGKVRSRATPPGVDSWRM